MIPREYADLIEKLTEKTDQKLVEWKTTPIENEFSVSFKDFSLTLFKGLNVGSDNAFIRLNIINARGKVIDQIFVNIKDEEGEQIEELYETARRRAFQIDRAIESMIRELDSLDDYEPMN